jgi:rhodanese-related sulfurtransferase
MHGTGSENEDARFEVYKSLSRDIEMSETDYVKTIFKRYWKILVKWLFHISGLPQITSDKLYERINSGHPPLLIDIRTAEDFNGIRASKYGHIPDARNIDIMELESHFEELEPYKEKEIVTMCSGGGLSLAAVEILMDAGFTDAKSLKGGTDRWHKKGYPTEQPNRRT